MFSRDGRILAAGEFDGPVLLVDVERGKQLGLPLLLGLPLKVDSIDPAYAVAFSPDGRTLATASGEGFMQLWDVPSHRPLGMVFRPPSKTLAKAVFALSFSADGRVLASGSDDGSVRLWEGFLWRDVRDLRATVCHLVVGELTQAEWNDLAPGVAYRRSCPS